MDPPHMRLFVSLLFLSSVYTLFHSSPENPHDIPFLPGSDMGPGEAKFAGTYAVKNQAACS